MAPQGSPHLPARPMEGKSWVLWLLGFLLLSIWLIRGSGSGAPAVDYSEFKRRVAAAEITQVEIGKERVVFTDSGGKRFSAVRVEDPTLASELAERKIPYRGLAESEWGSVIGLLF